MDRIDAMRAFVAVATNASFAGAARQLRLPPSAVTRGIAQLEADLGLTLFNRTTRVVRLTERGAIHLDSCRKILDDIDAAIARVRGQDAAPRGRLNIAAPILFGRLHVLPVVTGLLAAWPDLDVRLLLSDRNVHLVDDGFDVAVRIGDLADSALVATRLGSVCRVAVASPAYLAQRGTPQRPVDLADHDLIAFENLEASNDWHFGPDNAAVRVHPRLAVNSADAAIAAAIAGAGITRTLSYQVRDAVVARQLVLVLPDLTPPPVAVSAVYPPSRHAAPNVAAFVAASRVHFRDTPLVPPDQWGA